jgi:hypothetical protein
MKKLKITLDYIGKPKEFQFDNLIIIRIARTSGHDRESYILESLSYPWNIFVFRYGYRKSIHLYNSSSNRFKSLIIRH